MVASERNPLKLPSGIKRGDLLVHRTEELRSKSSSRHVDVGGLQLSSELTDFSLHRSALLSSEIAWVSGRCSPRGRPGSSNHRFSHLTESPEFTLTWHGLPALRQGNVVISWLWPGPQKQPPNHP